MLEPLAKLVVLLSLFAAAWAETWAASLAWPILEIIVPATFVISWLGSRTRPALARRLVLFACYFTPAFVVWFRGTFFVAGWMIWLAALLGVILAAAPTLRWAIPAVWKLPLVFWALVIAVTWPLIVLRENDFRWPIDPTMLAWVTLIALMTMTGILWFDALCAAYLQKGTEIDSFERQVAVPMAAGWFVSACVAVYQMFGDITFLNPGFWNVLRRVPGTLSDANPFGVISAMWGALLFAAGLESRTRWQQALGVVALPLSWVVVWGSGSRSSVVIVALSIAAVALWSYRVDRRKAGRLFAIALPILAVVFVGILLTRPGQVIGPVSRFTRDFSPDWSLAWVQQMTLNLWIRGNYGPVAEDMIRAFPLTGVGVGAFHFVWYAFAWRAFHVYVPADNAQNWFRHELAELGILGSLGALTWTVLFGWLLFKRAGHSVRSLTLTLLRAAIVGFGLISLVGMPGQDVAVVFTFWTIAFWLVYLMNGSRPVGTPEGKHIATWAWLVVFGIVLAFAGTTAYAAWTELRPPARACAAEMNYSYGMYAPEGLLDGAQYRWVEQQSVAAIQVNDPWLQVTVWVNHEDVTAKPIDVLVWTDRRRLLKARLSSIQPVTRYYKIPAGSSCVILETSVDRIVRSGRPGTPGRRNLGLLVAWKTIAEPPPGGIRLQ